MTTAQEIITNAGIILHDESQDRWSESELLGWINLGEKAIVVEKPDSNPVIEVVKLSTGSLQVLPTSAFQLLDVLCNMGTDGQTRGNIVSSVDSKWMNSFNPGWMSETASTVVKHVIYDTLRNPKMFWVYPKSPGTNYLEIMTAKIPTLLTAPEESLHLGDEYFSTLLHYVLAMSFAKDSDQPGNAQRAMFHYQTFERSLGLKEMKEETYTPQRNLEKR